MCKHAARGTGGGSRPLQMRPVDLFQAQQDRTPK